MIYFFKQQAWGIAIAAAALLFVVSSRAEAGLVLDAFGGVDPTTHLDWADAGVPGDTSTYAGGTITSAFGIFNISGGLTSNVTSTSGGLFPFNAGTFGANNMLGDYFAIQGGTTAVSLGGFDNTLTSSLGDMNGNTFTMVPNTDYVLTLFGAGDSDGQDSAFTFGGETKTTSTAIVGTAPDAGHSVDFAFTTPGSLSGFTLDFEVANNTSLFGAFNGAAITLAPTAIPEPSSALLVAVALTVGAVRRKRR